MAVGNELRLFFIGESTQPILGFMLGISFLLLSFAAYYYLKFGYQGGMYSLLGAISATFGIVILVNEVERNVHEIHDHDLGFGIGSTFVLIGIVLLVIGHRAHVQFYQRRISTNKN